MAGADPKAAALVMLTYAEIATLPRTRQGAAACNATLSRTRDFLMHAAARDLAVVGVRVTAGEFDALRGPALREMRSRCGACGLCAAQGLTPP
jgi:hypothetical protein